MEVRVKVKIVITVASLVAATVLFAAEYKRRRHRRKQTSSLSSCYLHSELKPQLGFKRVLADNSYSGFKHLKLDDGSSSIEKPCNCHPYETEMSVLLENPELEFEFLRGEYSLELSDAYVWVETESQLKEVAETLAKEKVFAVDTEQHSLRSFLGFTALIQISTQDKDFLVDTIALHDAMSILRPVFPNPDICKVFHGADNDVLWLQRDFHIYVVNMFDTAKACEVLSKPQRSLAYLLEAVCGVATDKMLRCEDWRQRPLSDKMVLYARTDTHYLLYMADRLRDELKQTSNFLLEAFRRSNKICLKLYTKETKEYPGNAAASSIVSRHLKGHGHNSIISLDAEELVRKLCAWRDLMGRVHDESTRYVLPDIDIVALVSQQPTTTMGIYDARAQMDLGTNLRSPGQISCFKDESSSGVIRSHLTDVHQIIQGGNLDDILPILLEKCLGTEHGTCPITVFNCSLLESFKTNNGFKQLTRKASRDKEKVSLKSTVYDNCSIYTKDGQLLGYCNRKKAEWYMKRGLAQEVAEKPLAIKFVFETKAGGQDFDMQSKKNVCVGCGEENQYQRFRIVPSCYRDHFPEHMKSHRSHDIVLLCLNCHRVAHAAAEKYKTEIAKEFQIPLFVQRTSHSEDAAVRRAAAALLQHGHRMPSSRSQELLETVKMHYGGRDISKEDLEKAVHIVSLDDSGNGSSKVSLLGHGVHGQQIVQSLLKESGEDGLQNFCQRWREVFVRAVHPRHLPHGWNVLNKL